MPAGQVRSPSHTTLDRPAARRASTPAMHAANAAQHAVTRTYTQIQEENTAARPSEPRDRGRPECLPGQLAKAIHVLQIREANAG
jgi:hypothetical protein